MTTNHLTRLDPALIRPGRVDYKQYLGNASVSQIKTMFLRFFDSTELAGVFVGKLEMAGVVGKVSPAMLQGHFVRYRDDPNEAIKHIEKLIDTCK